MPGDEWTSVRSRIPGRASLRGRALPGHVIAVNEVTEELLFEADEMLGSASFEARPTRRYAVYPFEFEARPSGGVWSRR